MTLALGALSFRGGEKATLSECSCHCEACSSRKEQRVLKKCLCQVRMHPKMWCLRVLNSVCNVCMYVCIFDIGNQTHDLVMASQALCCWTISLACTFYNWRSLRNSLASWPSFFLLYCGLNMKCLPKTPVLKIWSLIQQYSEAVPREMIGSWRHWTHQWVSPSMSSQLNGLTGVVSHWGVTLKAISSLRSLPCYLTLPFSASWL